MAYSTIPAVLAALVSTARGVLPESVSVYDGQPDRDPSDECVVIGFTGNPLEAAVEDTRTVEEITRERDRERYEVTNLASSWLGQETDLQAVRLRAFSFVDAVAAALAQDQTLGGVCMRARVSVVGLAQMQTNRGAEATIMFTVAVDAFTGRS
ncbi:hypothetical protein [Nonomuraea sp. NPDC050786]|uniref:hypothetical protein n=1 Tax=Nonomuraea sp. NPDC050786 TaxID=3154840 RepID=UPI00340FDE75